MSMCVAAVLVGAVLASVTLLGMGMGMGMECVCERGRGRGRGCLSSRERPGQAERGKDAGECATPSARECSAHWAEGCAGRGLDRGEGGAVRVTVECGGVCRSRRRTELLLERRCARVRARVQMCMAASDSAGHGGRRARRPRVTSRSVDHSCACTCLDAACTFQASRVTGVTACFLCESNYQLT